MGEGKEQLVAVQLTVFRAYCLSLWGSDGPERTPGNLEADLARRGLAGLQRGGRVGGEPPFKEQSANGGALNMARHG